MSFHQFHHHSFTFTHWYPVFVAVVVCPRLSPDCMSPRCCFHLFFPLLLLQGFFYAIWGMMSEYIFCQALPVLSVIVINITSGETVHNPSGVRIFFFFHSNIVFLAIVYFILVHFLSYVDFVQHDCFELFWFLSLFSKFEFVFIRKEWWRWVFVFVWSLIVLVYTTSKRREWDNR